MSPLPLIVSILTTPWADAVISYDQGIGPAPGYTIASAAIGEPTRFTGEGIWPGVVSQFNTPWLADEIVSIGGGGHLVIFFDEPVQDDPNNPWGIDLIVFGNTGFVDGAWPSAIVSDVFSDDNGTIEVSADGKQWVAITTQVADGLWPTCGYSDSQPYDETEGQLPTDFTMPIDPRLTLDDVMNLDHPMLMMYYGTSGGGTGIDLAETGLAEISYVRISTPENSKLSPEIDAFADVQPQLQGDVDMNGVVDVNDLLILISTWGPLPVAGPLADFNGDWTVDVSDLLVVIGNWS
jgi:hypothetical protein